MIRDMTFDGGKNYDTLVLVSPKDFNKTKLEEVYIRPLEKMGVPANSVLVVCLDMPKGRVTATQAREFLAKIEAPIKSLDIQRVLCTQGAYFKVMAKVTKVTNTHGRAFDSLWDIPVFYAPSAAQFYFDPKIEVNINMSLNALARHSQGLSDMLGTEDLGDRVEVLLNQGEIDNLLAKAKEAPKVYVDIETNGLQVGSGVISISFSFDMSRAYAFTTGQWGEVYRSLKDFFNNAKGEIIFHNAPFDAKQLIWKLFMKGGDDYEGMLCGLHAMFRHLGDTKILSYLALNNTSKAELSLKNLAYEFAGDYSDGIDFEDYDKPVKDYTQLLTYNGIDTMATAYVYDKYRKTVYEEQETVYQELFLPSLKVITQMEMTGLPLNFATVLRVEQELQGVQDQATLHITQHPDTQKALVRIREQEAVKANAKLKKLRKTADDFLHIKFNPRSGNHLRVLLYEVLEMEIKKSTDSGLPSTGSPALKQMRDFLEHNKDPRVKLIQAILDLQEVAIINSTFIPAFKEKSFWKYDGWRYLPGSFNLGGTVSGRLSSSNPNLQNIPSTGTKYAKHIKQCVQAPPGWIIVGADYFSLEDRISALQTKDPNKLAVYTDGYDGHCLRAYSYFKDQMPDITQELETPGADRVNIINSIEYKHKDLRQLSKGPTFALTYMGTWKTLVETFGLTRTEAKQIESEYHTLYKVSDDWVTEQMRQAQENGYVELAFGLRLRTPSLPRCLDIKDKHKLPYEAYGELKTAANALGQSYGLLNNHSANMFMQRVWDSEYAHDILPIAQIHDSQYYMIRNTYGCLKFVNDNLVDCMEWCELPAIKHDEVGLGSSLEIFWPTWADAIEIPNGASMKEMYEIIQKEIS